MQHAAFLATLAAQTRSDIGLLDDAVITAEASDQRSYIEWPATSAIFICAVRPDLKSLSGGVRQCRNLLHAGQHKLSRGRHTRCRICADRRAIRRTRRVPVRLSVQNWDAVISRNDPVRGVFAGRKAFWVEIMKIFTTQYWVVIFTSDDWFIKRMKRAYIVIGLFLPCFFLVLVVIPGLLGRL